jgi:hypothetical protein
MTVEVAPRRVRKPKVANSAEGLAIGEIDQTIFACPACARPLALGARRCAGCGTRLILGVQARRASIFLGAGFGAGLAVAVAFAGLTSMLAAAFAAPVDGAVATAAPLPVPSAAPSTGPVASAPNSGTSSVPDVTKSALRQAVAIDDRLVGSATALSQALAAPRFDIQKVGAILRATSADAGVGLQLAERIAVWSGGRSASEELAAFYSAVQATAAEGLSASIHNEDAYRATGQKMVDLLAGVDAVDERVRDVADNAGVTLP